MILHWAIATLQQIFSANNMKKNYFYKMAKRTFQVLPVVFLSMAGMLSLFFCCLTAFRLDGRVKVGVTASGEDKMVSALVTYVEHMNDIASSCEFTTVNEEDGREQLEQGEISALIVIPEGILSRIYKNENVNVRVYLPQNPTLESGLIREFSEACASLVLSAKSGDYTAYELYQRYGISGDKRQVVRDMNIGYISFAMLQEKLFANEIVAGEDGMSDGNRFFVAGLTCLLLLLGIPAAGLRKRTPVVLEMQLQRKGVTCIFQQLVMTGLLTACMYVSGVIALVVAYIYTGLEQGLVLSMLCLLPVCFAVASLFQFLYSCGGGTVGTVLVIFLLAVFLVFMPGGIFPPYILPSEIVCLGQILPGGLMMKIFWRCMWQNKMGWECLFIFLYGISFFLLSIWIRGRGGRKR